MQLTTTLPKLIANCLGTEPAPGWLVRDVPGGTMFDMRNGRVEGPLGTFVRSPESGRWAKVH